ncbi:MAG TPA: DnaJ domain-containing protein [Candidatus Limnocylindrales bacterium]|nr:DnaJ domain-containing protein [Candidatus Limnocylindrales bacterium]
MTNGFDPYKTLQVDPEADPDIIQAAYRRLAQRFHPDHAGGAADPDRMVAINRAWSVLSDPARRAAHDRQRAIAASERAGSAQPAAGPATAGSPATARRRPHDADEGQAVARAKPASDAARGEPVLNFGRYAGSSLTEIARVDPEYLEWLDRMPIGRPWRAQIDQLLRSVGRRLSPEVEAAQRHGLFRRR